MSKPARDSLPPGTYLDCYRIVKLLGSGGFSLIYLAEDEDTHDEVAIKEYLPKDIGKRAGVEPVTVVKPTDIDRFYRGKRLFYQEAKALATLRHNNIVNVRNCFLSNDTAYLVMDYEPGKNLGRYIRKRQGGLSTSFLLTVFPPLLDALELIHRHQHLHLDIKPSNVHLRPGGNPLLLDFGAVYHLDPAKGDRKAQVITPGFSPIEQYDSKSQVGPWTDAYAVGASMRACIEGCSPPASVDRAKNDTLAPAALTHAHRYPDYLLEAIDWAMRLEPGERPQSAGDLRDALLERKPMPTAAHRGRLVPPG
jgi:serine/threonine protein kinase